MSTQGVGARARRGGGLVPAPAQSNAATVMATALRWVSMELGQAARGAGR
jgi:hypothetical protein